MRAKEASANLGRHLVRPTSGATLPPIQVGWGQSDSDSGHRVIWGGRGFEHRISGPGEVLNEQAIVTLLPGD